MAQLTWRNVDAPTFGSVTDSLRLMGQMMNTGFDAARGSLQKYEADRTQLESNKLMAEIMGAQDPAALKASLAGGLLGKFNPEFLTADALQFANNQEHKLLDNQAQGLINDKFSYGFDRQKDQDAANPAYQTMLAGAQPFRTSGDVAGLEAYLARPENVAAATAAGADFTKMIQDAYALTQGSVGTKNQVTVRERTLEDIDLDKQARELTDKIRSQYPNLEEAVRGLAQDFPGVDSRVISRAGQRIKDPSLWGDMLVGDSLGSIGPSEFTTTGSSGSSGSSNFLDVVMGKETSGGTNVGKNPNSSAIGPFQITNRWWKDMVNSPEGRAEGLTMEDQAKPDAQRTAMQIAEGKYEARVASAGLPINNGNKYMVHFLGNGDFAKAAASMRQDGGKVSAAALMPEAAKANPNVFYKLDAQGKRTIPRTVGEVWANQTRGMNTPQADANIEAGRQVQAYLGNAADAGRLGAAKDSAMNPYADVDEYMRTRKPGQGLTNASKEAARIVEAYGKTNPDLTPKVIQEAIERTVKEHGVAYDVAGFLVERSLTFNKPSVLRKVLGEGWTPGDSGMLGVLALSDAATTAIGKTPRGKEGPIDFNKIRDAAKSINVGTMSVAEGQATAPQQAAKLQADLAKAQSALQQAEARAAKGHPIDIEHYRLMYGAQIADITNRLQGMGLLTEANAVRAQNRGR